MREDTVRLWRSEFARGGVEALKATVRRPPPVKTEAALRVVAPLLEAPVADRPNWTIPRLMAEIEAREGVKIGKSQLSKALRKLPLAAARHTLKGRQIAAEIERVGLRLQLRKAQAEAGDIILLYGDESEALTHPYLARAWALRGADLRVPAPGQAKKVAIIGSLDHVTRQLSVHTSQTKRSRDFIAHLEQLDHLFGPHPGRAIKPVVLVEDTGRSMSASSLLKPSRRANTGSPSSGCQNTHPNSTTSRLSGTLKARHLAHQTFADADALDRAIHAAVAALNRERTVNPLVFKIRRSPELSMAWPTTRPLLEMPNAWVLPAPGTFSAVNVL